MHEVVDQGVDGVDRLRPRALDVAQGRALRDAPFFADELPRRVSSRLIRWLRSTTSLKASAIRSSMPAESGASRTLKSPFFSRVSAFRRWRRSRPKSLDARPGAGWSLCLTEGLGRDREVEIGDSVAMAPP